MSAHSYSRIWVHLVWATKNRSPLLIGEAGLRTAGYLRAHVKEHGIYLKICHVGPDHTHVLIDLPTNLSVEQGVKLLKGSTSHWINQNRIIPERFEWQIGYGAFSLSQSTVPTLCRYVARQEEHHRRKDFQAELRELVEAYGLVWREETQTYSQTVKTVSRGEMDAPTTE